MERSGRRLESVGGKARANLGLGGRLFRNAAFASAFFVGGFCATLYWESQNAHHVSLMSAHGAFANCREATQAGAAPLYQGQPGYAPWLDADHDGVACKPYRQG